MFDIKNVLFVSNNCMCTGCGVCAAICPHNAINMIVNERKGSYQARVNFEVCTGCTICLKSCPPLTWSNEQKTDKYNELIGDYINSYAVYANDEYIRINSASGGFVTTLLIYLLEKKYISGAVVVKRDKDSPLFSNPFIATTKEEILNAKGSKYSPVKYDKVIKDIIENNYKDLAVVGLPCHIEGISKAMLINKKLRDRIKYKISLVCGQAPNFLAYEYIMNKFGIKIDEIKELKNRGDGWPGYMQIKTDTKDIKVPYRSKYSMGMVLSSPLFTPLACQMCPDPVGFEADICVSDAWLDKYMGDTQGISLILTKSKAIDTIVKQMSEDKYITLIEEDVESFIKANKFVINYKSKFNKFKLDHFIKKNIHLYSSSIQNHTSLTLIQKFKLMIFILHLKFIKKLNIKKILPKLNDVILFYFKVLNLLKR